MTGLKPNLWTLLLVAVLIAAGLLYANGTLMVRRDQIAPHVFSGHEGKLRVLLVTDTSQEERDLFFQLINGFTLVERFDTRDRPTSPDHADIVLFVLRDWSDVDRLPFQTEFAKAYDDIRQTPSTADKLVVDAKVFNDRDFQLVFYNLSALEGATWRCLAADFVSLYLPWDARITQDLQSCIATTTGDG